MKRILLALLTAALALTASALDGAWSGRLDLGSKELTIVLNFSAGPGGTTVCTLDSPDQTAYGIPATIDHLSADSLAVSMPSLGASYRAGVYPDRLMGVFRQRTLALPLILTPGGPKLDRPQTPRPPLPYQTREVTFRSGDATLSGTLTMPVRHKSGQPVKAVVMVSGSGQQNRDEEMFGHKPFAVLADYLAREGVASLRYDDRGVGKSEGDPLTVTVESNAADAAAALDMLRTLPDIESVGVIGHSEGGMIAFMLAAGADAPDFAISLAGPVIPTIDVLCYQNRVALEGLGILQGSLDQYIDLYRELMLAKAAGQEVTADALAAYKGYQLPPSLMQNLRAIASQPLGKWMTSFLLTDPAEAVRKARIPMLLVGGQLDMQVPAEANKEAFLDITHSLTTDYPKREAMVFTVLNHLLQTATTGLPSEYSTISETIAPEALMFLTLWINRQP